MPVLNPITSVLTFSIGDLVNEVILKVENRTSDSDRAAIWLRDALLEISSNPDYRDDFDQLQEFGNQFNLVIGQQEYDEAPIIPSGDVNLATLDFLIWLDYPTNTVRKKLEQMSFQESDRFQPLNSLPTQWYRFANNIGFNPVPDQPYQVQPRILRMHPIDDNSVIGTNILLPREWNHILVHAAAEFGFIEYGEYEKASSIHQLLYGDPDRPKEPGMIKKAKRRLERERWRSTQALRPVYKPMGWGH
jgi:hypothetical protein